MDYPVPFGIWLKQRRHALRLTQQELAARAGCALTTLKKIEAGARRPSARLAAHLAEHLQLSATRDLFLQVAQGKLDTALLPAPAEFPDAAAHAGPRPQLHHLPVVLTPLIGRAREVAAIWAALERDGVRLLTLTGPPGVGKTRLSVQVVADLCDSYPDGVVFVALGAISDPALVTPAIAHALGVREAAGEPHAAGLLDRLHAALHGQHLLLVLDNFEQVAEAAPVVGALLAAPRLQILVTSRVPLHLSGEYTYPVPPLALPDRDTDGSSGAAIEQLREVESVRLFVERAHMVNPDFAITSDNARPVAAICRHLDGLP